MDSKQNRKEMQRAYKQQDEVGCICLYENHKNGRYLILGEPSKRGAENRFSFSKVTGSCVHMLLMEDWKEYGADAFTLTILDTLKKDPDQSPADFKDELQALANMYLAGRPAELAYKKAKE